MAKEGLKVGKTQVRKRHYSSSHGCRRLCRNPRLRRAQTSRRRRSGSGQFQRILRFKPQTSPEKSTGATWGDDR
uniref:Uncharacterized protein MANES_01G074000 n=1 Tax=Rhizophora mucronata TaxID=61149 RepID=A0A2P2IHS3_RHIMU